jgi:hypothetical protein
MAAPPVRRLSSVRRYVCLGVSLCLAGCGTARQVVAAPVRETGVTASCVGLSSAAQFAAARLVFVGRMLPGPATRFGVLRSPARIRVDRYLKGHGPRIVKVDTAVTDATTIVEDGISPRAGQRWKIYTSSRRQPFQTSICAGSGRAPVSSRR